LFLFFEPLVREMKRDMEKNEIEVMKIKQTHDKRTRAFILLQKRTGSDKIIIGGMDDENDTKKRNAYN